MENRVVSKQTGNESESTSNRHKICTFVGESVGQDKATCGVEDETQLKGEEQKEITKVPVRWG